MCSPYATFFPCLLRRLNYFSFFPSKTLLDLLEPLFMPFMVNASKKNIAKKIIYLQCAVLNIPDFFTFLWAKFFLPFFSSKSLLDLSVHLFMVIASEKNAKKYIAKYILRAEIHFGTNIFLRFWIFLKTYLYVTLWYVESAPIGRLIYDSCQNIRCGVGNRTSYIHH